MPRPERPLSPDDGPVQRFAALLRQLRADAGQPGYRQMAKRAGYSATSLSDAAGGRQLPGWAVVQAYVTACDGDIGDWEKRWREVSAEVAACRAPSHVDSGAPRSPYLGLAGFQTSDADRFFGRDHLVEELAERLTQTRFLAISGASGVGKSSVLRAGLIPKVDGGKALVLTPGDHPMEHLPELRAATGQLVVVDQFEEIFTLCRDSAERDAFVELLLDFAFDADESTRVVLGVRADFLAGCAQHPKLAALMSESLVFVAPMSDEQLQLAITGPAAQAGITLERTLVAQVLADTRGQPGALPLMSHAMLETWRQRRSDLLTLTGYQAAGAISGAIARTAEEIHARLDDRHQRLLQHLMIRLTALGEGTEDTRRRVQRSELDFDGADRLLDELVTARLVVVHEGAVEIAHEALIGAWPRLQRWLTDDRDALVHHRQLTEAAQLWETLDHDASALLRGNRLAIANEWAGHDDHVMALTGTERSFLDASLAAEVAEAEVSIRRTHQLKRLSTFLTALLVCVAIAAGIAVWQWNNAESQSREATSRELAIHALASAPTDVVGAMRYSLEAYAAAPTVEARGSLLSLASHQNFDGRFATEQPVKEVAFSPDGQLLVGATQDTALVVWDVPHRTEVARLSGGHTRAVRAVAVSKDDLVVSGGLDGAVVLWDLRQAKLLKTLRARVDDVDHGVESVSISPDGTIVAVSSRTRPIELWSLPAGEPLGTLLPSLGEQFTRVAFGPAGHLLASAGGKHDTTVTIWDTDTRQIVRISPKFDFAPNAVAVSPDGHTIAVGSEQSADLALWDSASPDSKALYLKGHTHSIRALNFSPDGARLVSGGYDEFVIVWDVGRKAPITRLIGHSSELYSAVFSPDGRTIATGSRDRSVLLYDEALRPLSGHTDRVITVAISPDNRMLASGGKDAAIMIWDIAQHKRVAVLTGHTNRVADVAYSPDGKTLASASDDKTVCLWKVADWTARCTGKAEDIARAVSFSPDGTVVAVAYPNFIRIMDVGTGEVKLTIPHPKQTISKVIFGHDNRTIYVGGESERTITVHDLITNAEYVLDQPAPVTDLALDSTGKTLAAGSPDGTLTVWDLPTRTRRIVRNAHLGVVDNVRFSSDNRYVATGGADQKVNLWDVSTLNLWAQLSGHEYDVEGLAFSRDGKTLYSGSIDQTIISWYLDPADARKAICADLDHEFRIDLSNVEGCTG